MNRNSEISVPNKFLKKNEIKFPDKDKHLLDLNDETLAPTSLLPEASHAPALEQSPPAGQGIEGAVPMDNKVVPEEEKEEASQEKPSLALGAPATALVLKFQPNSEPLPSEQEVRARFARFGPLENDGRGTRVSTATKMGMVVYKFRSHAEAALSYSRNQAMFGDQIEYRGYLVDFGAPPLRASPSTPGTGSSGGGGGGMNPVSVGRQPIKSILRKRERGDRGDGASADGGAPRRTRRVRFSLDSEDETPASPANSNDGGSRSAMRIHNFVPSHPSVQ